MDTERQDRKMLTIEFKSEFEFGPVNMNVKMPYYGQYDFMEFFHHVMGPIMNGFSLIADKTALREAMSGVPEADIEEHSKHTCTIKETLDAIYPTIEAWDRVFHGIPHEFPDGTETYEFDFMDLDGELRVAAGYPDHLKITMSHE